MAQWLYNSSGQPVAFVSGGDKVFSHSGQFIGRLDKDEVWHGAYKGEVVQGDLFLYKNGKGSTMRGTPGTPGTPGIPGRPGTRGARGLPFGYSDVDLD
ncbi:4-fold beta flower protein [Corallococcus carmarthensis]|uniref:4-fold beta flower protein n=1 Tax=Corallococcus carmarthensis TaxID=2316728 RepID=UPI002698EEDF